MAGKYQHIIHQHFLKPFVMTGGGDRLWVYRRGHAEAVPVPRSRAAAQRYYYSKPSLDGQSTLDEKITSYEDELKHLVERARSVLPGNNLDAHEIAEIAVHMMIRSSHMREIIDDGAGALLETLRSLISEPGTFLDGIELSAQDVPPWFANKLEGFLRKEGIIAQTQLTSASLVRIFYFFLRENGPKLLQQTEQLGNPFFEQMSATLEGLGA